MRVKVRAACASCRAKKVSFARVPALEGVLILQYRPSATLASPAARASYGAEVHVGS